MLLEIQAKINCLFPQVATTIWARERWFGASWRGPAAARAVSAAASCRRRVRDVEVPRRESVLVVRIVDHILALPRGQKYSKKALINI